MAYTSRFPQIVVEMNANVARVVERAGFRVEAGAKRRARYDTGYMRGQIRWTPIDAFSGEVIGGAHYTIYNEYGTIYMSAQPMFAPAVEEVRPLFVAEMQMAIREAVK
jgi:HK97 gp10 family phage protein